MRLSDEYRETNEAFEDEIDPLRALRKVLCLARVAGHAEQPSDEESSYHSWLPLLHVTRHFSLAAVASSNTVFLPLGPSTTASV